MDSESDLGILITNISSESSETRVREFFSTFGQVKSVKIIPDKFNEGSNICYMKFDSEDAAKDAVRVADKSEELGSPIRVSLKKIITKSSYDSNNSSQNRVNGTRTYNSGPRGDSSSESNYKHGGHSEVAIPNRQNNTLCGGGRGRGAVKNGSKLPIPSSLADITLDNLNIPLNKKLDVEIIELKDVNGILVRPIQMTEETKTQIAELMMKYNENTSLLNDVMQPKVGCHYLVKWREDDQFYRAKILEIISTKECIVSFVDEGNSGDVVNEIKYIPDELQKYPCQFSELNLQCQSSDDFVNFIISRMDLTSVSMICNKSVDSKLVGNIFISNTDVVSLFKKDHGVDIRKNPYSQESQISTYEFNKEYKDYQILTTPTKPKDVFKIVIVDPLNVKPKLMDIDGIYPIVDDVIIYKQSKEFLHRAVVVSSKFKDDLSIIFKLRLIDENRCVDVSIDHIGNATNLIQHPPRVINCYIDNDTVSNLSNGSIRILGYDKSKDVYRIQYIENANQTDISNETIEHSAIKVASSYFSSLPEFYFNCIDDSEKIQNLTDELSSYNAKTVSEHDIKVGKLVIAPYQGELYRARIINVIDSKTVNVLFIDYGNSEEVKCSELLEASSKLVNQKPFALKCNLNARIKPEFESTITKLLEKEFEDILEITIKSTKEDGIHTLNFIDILVAGKSDDGSKNSFLDLLLYKQMILPLETQITNNSVKGPSIPSSCTNNNNSTSIDNASLIQRIKNLEQRISLLEASLQ